MRLFSSVLTFSLLHSVGFVNGHWETGLDGDLYGETPRPTNEPLLYRTFSLLHNVGFVAGHWETGLDGDLHGEIPRPTNQPLLHRDLNHGAVLMETSLGHLRSGTTRRDQALGARQNTCTPGYVLTCPVTNVFPCCPDDHPICCGKSSTMCCNAGSFCVGLSTCCLNDQVGCTNPEGCCPANTTCCGLYCCTQGYECHSGTCVNLALSSLSVQSVASVASVETEYGTGDSNNVALVGGVVGAVVGVIVLGLLGFFLWKHKRGSPVPPSATQQSFFGQQPSSHPITPASATFSTNTGYLIGPPVTYAAQAGWHPQQSTVPQSVGSRTGGQTSAASQQSAPPSHIVNTWIERPSTIHQENYGGYASQSQPRPSPSSPVEAPVDPRELYSGAVRGSTHSVLASNIPSSSGASGSAPPPAPAYHFTPPVPEKAGPWKF